MKINIKNLPALVINLDNRPDKYEIIHNHLNKYLIQHKRIPAVPTKDITITNYNRPAELGILLSHRTAICHLKLNNELYGMILEDDAEFNVSPDVLQQYLLHLPHDFDIISLGREIIAEEYSKVKVDYIRFNKYFIRHISGEIWGAHCYIISRKAYDKVIALLDDHTSKVSLADVAIYQNTLNVYLSNYSLVKQTKGYSDNHEKNTEVLGGRWRNDGGVY